MNGSFNGGVSKSLLGSKTKPADFKSQSPPWRKRCPPSCRVHKGTRPLCSLLPMKLGGLVPPRQGGAWSFQSRSSTLWLASCCREQIRGSCQLPAKTHNSQMIQENRTQRPELNRVSSVIWPAEHACLFLLKTLSHFSFQLRAKCLSVRVCVWVRVCKKCENVRECVVRLLRV